MRSEESNHTTAERITMTISIVILAMVIGLASWASFATGDSAPRIEVDVSLNEVREEPSGYYVPITITNNGGRTAQSVVVSGELVTDAPQPETAEVTIDFLAGGESETAELVFASDPVSGELTIRPASFLHP